MTDNRDKKYIEIKNKFSDIWISEELNWDRCCEFLIAGIDAEIMEGRKPGPYSYNGEWFIMLDYVGKLKNIIDYNFELIEKIKDRINAL